ncbi:MAG: hypothetical protein IKM59_07770 [Oscillospiraceae bacterium]|nr:hypothetical protein [Oscillospiraceae bacterium]
MKSMTPFQEALLASTEAQFAEVPEEEQIEIQPSPAFYSNRPGKKKSLNPLWKAILIAATVALFVGAAFAAHFNTLGNVEVYDYPFPAEVEACDVYVIKFHEEFANSHAPETIKTFYLPTLDVSVETADPGWVMVSDREKAFYPLLERTDFADPEAPENTNDIQFADQMPKDPIEFSSGWTLYSEDYMNSRQITYWQKTAKSVPIGTDFYSIAYLPEFCSENQVETLQIGPYEVLSIFVDWIGPHAHDPHTTTYWFWTDGDYIFQLSADDADVAYMQALMESIQPVDDMF